VGGLPLIMGPLIEGRLGLWNGLLDHISIFSRSRRVRRLILVGNESAEFTQHDEQIQVTKERMKWNEKRQRSVKYGRGSVF
jgi:hypothetical protein